MRFPGTCKLNMRNNSMNIRCCFEKHRILYKRHSGRFELLNERDFLA